MAHTAFSRDTPETITTVEWAEFEAEIANLVARGSRTIADDAVGTSVATRNGQGEPWVRLQVTLRRSVGDHR